MTDPIDLQLGAFTVPDAIKRTVMGVANHIKKEHDFRLDEKIMNELFDIAEQLEARVQDELEKVQPIELSEQEDSQIPIEETTISMTGDGEIINHTGTLYAKLCNEPVADMANVADPEIRAQTFCIKKYGHRTVHEDELGQERL